MGLSQDTERASGDPETTICSAEDVRMPLKKSVAHADPLSEPELPPLVYDRDWLRPIETREFAEGHWIGFLFLLPVVVMLTLHEPLGMTDAFLMGDRVSANYNLMTFASLFLGSAVFVVYAFALPLVKGGGWRWVPPKIIFLVVFWGIVMLAISWMSALRS
jgi:hypothetical protein